MFKKSAVLILHFAPSLRFALSLQSAVCILHSVYILPLVRILRFYTDLYQNSVIYSLHSKRLPSSYCAKVEARTKKKKLEVGGGGRKRKNFLLSPPPSPSYLFIFSLVPSFSTNSRGNACYAGYRNLNSESDTQGQNSLRSKRFCTV